ncbi:MAG: carboxymuconolactone decarboxylase family protein [Nocardioidaceae bacterium]|jgi:alkylhydroperoxidase/carboxymuconolactone decarboxylase family protein YurZ
MAEDRPLLDTMVEMNASSISHAGLNTRDLMMVRLAALAAVDAPPASYLMNLRAAADAGLTAEDMRSILIAVAPIVGTPEVVNAAGSITRALGIALALDDAIENGEL